MSWIISIFRWIYDHCKDKKRREQREQDRSENFILKLEIKPREGHLQVTANVVNHSLFQIQVEKVVFYCPPSKEIIMKHGDSRSGVVNRNSLLPFHCLKWDPGSVEDIQNIPPSDLNIKATTATGVAEIIDGEQIKEAALTALK